ncbi:glycosyltransferase, partial [Flavobacterium sp. XS1P32]
MLAIVIPYYKHFFFDATLASLSIQTNMHFKVYIGDDASLENPNDLLEKYKGKFDFEYCRFQGNLGGISLVQQWERCIAMTGDEQWIMILGDDDVLQENCVASFYANLSEINANDCKVVRFATQVINQDNKIISDIFYHPKIENSVEFVMRKLKGHTRSSLSEYIFDKNKLITTQFRDFPLAWYSDLLGVLEFSD